MRSYRRSSFDELGRDRPVGQLNHCHAGSGSRQAADWRASRSGATAGEGTQNLLCAYTAAGVLVGLGANAAFGWSWLDPVIALVIAAIAVREGREAWEGEGCACVAIPGLDAEDCQDGCC